MHDPSTTRSRRTTLPGGGDGALHVGRRRVGNGTDDRFGCGVDVVVGPGALRLDQLPVDQHPRLERKFHGSPSGDGRPRVRTWVASCPMRIAALDLGSNSFHLLVADVHLDGTFTAVAREKEMLRLGDDVARHGRIPGPTADRAVAAVRRLRQLADALGARRSDRPRDQRDPQPPPTAASSSTASRPRPASRSRSSTGSRRPGSSSRPCGRASYSSPRPRCASTSAAAAWRS